MHAALLHLGPHFYKLYRAKLYLGKLGAHADKRRAAGETFFAGTSDQTRL